MRRFRSFRVSRAAPVLCPSAAQGSSWLALRAAPTRNQESVRLQIEITDGRSCRQHEQTSFRNPAPIRPCHY